jgi:hypothetical protein
MLLKSVSPFAGFAKPRNYRERLSYVNLETPGPALLIAYSANRQHLYLTTSGQCLYLLLDPRLILFTANYFGAQNDRLDNGALMHHGLGSFATRKPAFWCQKDKDQNDHTQEIPLPGVSSVIPEEDLLKCGEQASHVLKLASKQPREPWLAGELILASAECPVNENLAIWRWNNYSLAAVSGSTIWPSRICTMRLHIAAASGL